MSNLEISRAPRLDQYVAGAIPRISRAYAVKLIEQGKVTINGEPVLKAGAKIRATDTVQIDFDEAELDIIPDIELEILYEDDDCVVINKPSGVLTHSKGVYNPEATVGTWLRSKFDPADISDAKEVVDQRVGIVHRLDRATSGVMICAKNAASLKWLQKQFSQRRVKKTYVAVVTGVMNPAEAIIDMPLERNPKQPQTFRVGINGKAALTHYRVLDQGESLALVELKPTTGRTHQLRVHLAHQGHPIVGDTLYKGAEAERLYLHARELELTLPNRERRTFSVPVPDSFAEKVHNG